MSLNRVKMSNGYFHPSARFTQWTANGCSTGYKSEFYYLEINRLFFNKPFIRLQTDIQQHKKRIL